MRYSAYDQQISFALDLEQKKKGRYIVTLYKIIGGDCRERLMSVLVDDKDRAKVVVRDYCNKQYKNVERVESIMSLFDKLEKNTPF